MKEETGERIQWIIKNLSSKSVNDFATSIGVSNQTVNAWVSGKYGPSFESLVEICKVYRVNPEWILLGTGEPTGAVTLPFLQPLIEMARIEPGVMGLFMERFEQAVEVARRMWPNKFGNIVDAAQIGAKRVV